MPSIDARFAALWLFGTGLVALFSAPALAQPQAPAAATTAPAAECFPPCREGFVCSAGQCVSLCNPPCAQGEMCVEGRRCEAAPPPLEAAYEPPPPIQKPFAARSHAMLGFHFGFGGDLRINEAESSLGNTYGVNLRSDLPIAEYVLLGPLFQFGVWQSDLPEASSHYYVDLDLYLRLRLPVSSKKNDFQVWAGVPIGLTLNILGEDTTQYAGLGVGWNIGVMVGGAVHFTPKFGLFSELGWQQHKFNHDSDVTENLDHRLAQWKLNLGFVFRN
jgi:hypothetical protein